MLRGENFREAFLKAGSQETETKARPLSLSLLVFRFALIVIGYYNPAITKASLNNRHDIESPMLFTQAHAGAVSLSSIYANNQR